MMGNLDSVGAKIFRALTTKQETMATLTAPATDYLTRLQRCLIVASMLLAMFTVQIWFFWSQARNCCADLRLLLGCPAAGTCRGFDGDCAGEPRPACAADRPWTLTDRPPIPIRIPHGPP